MGSHSIGSLQGGENGFNLTMNVMEILNSLNSLVWITQSFGKYSEISGFLSTSK